MIPSELRHNFRRAARLEAIVYATYRPHQVVPSHLALTDAQRQHRRLTWAERDAWNELPDDAEVRIVFAGWQNGEAEHVLASIGYKKTQHSEKAA